MTDLNYGDRVLVSAKLKRAYLGNDERGMTIRGYKREPLLSSWRLLEKPEGAEPYEGKWGQVEVKKRGIFLGYRTLTSGYVIPGYGGGSWDDYYPPEYRVTERTKVAYVSIGANTNPIHVPLDAIERAEPGDAS